MSLPLAEREARVGELECMGNLELHRANNTAKNEAELAKSKNQRLLGLGTDETTGSTMGKKRKRASGGRTAKPRAKQASRKRGRVEKSDEEESAESSEEEEDGAKKTRPHEWSLLRCGADARKKQAPQSPRKVQTRALGCRRTRRRWRRGTQRRLW
jgi:hypothetical protein